MIQVRRAIVSDLPAVLGLQVHGWKQVYAGLLPDSYLANELESERLIFWTSRFSRTAPNQLIAVVEQEGVVIAVVCAFGALAPGGEACVESLYVARSNQNRGIGGFLLRYAASWCAVNFASTSISLSVVKANTAALEFYRKLGAQLRGTEIWEPSCGGSILSLELYWPDIGALKEAA